MDSGALRLPPLRRISEWADPALDHVIFTHPDLDHEDRVRCYLTPGGAVVCDRCPTLQTATDTY